VAGGLLGVADDARLSLLLSQLSSFVHLVARPPDPPRPR
jgi:hypothetical protein